ncbi:hypothetical protein CWO27_11455 [Vibrio sp. 10N.286.51.C3]|nr:hypothetical protein CWO27_23170 [Vibrio sp. 10N.286.51.C3]PTP14220.1 hypothetical protein CWO27_11455 [Vibrio sp. 10N.286.51.C3]
MSDLFCIWRSGKAEGQIRVSEMRDAKSLRVDASKRDTGYEERKRKIRVNEMRDTKSLKGRCA